MEKQQELKPIKDNSVPAKVVIIFLWIAAGLLAVLFFANLKATSLFDRIFHGEADPRMTEQFVALIDVPRMIYLLVTLVGAIIFIFWMARANKNLQTCGKFGGLRYGTGLSIGGWFIPFASFVIPYNVIAEIWECTQKLAYVRTDADKSKVKGNGRIGIWWAFFLIYHFFENLGIRSILSLDYNGVSAGLFLLSIAYIGGIFAAIFCIRMVKAISKAETDALLRHNSEAEQHGNPFFNAAGAEGQAPETSAPAVPGDPDTGDEFLS